MTALSTLGMLFFLEQIRRHRKNNVMRLSQWPYLAAFLVASMTLSLSALLLNPNYGCFRCKIYPYLVHLCLTAIYSILIARVWRVYSLISPVVYSSRPQPLVFHFFDRLVAWDECCGPHGLDAGPNMRRHIKDVHMMRLMAFIAFPSFVFLLSTGSYQNENIVIYDEANTIGRVVCSNFEEASQALGLLILVIYQILLVVCAYLASELPSFLNETQLIFRASWTNFIFSCLCGMVVILSSEPTNSPTIAVSYLIF